MGNSESNIELNQKCCELILELDKFPELDIGDRMGSTDYIDFIKMDEVPHSIMCGLDKFKRYFLVMKLIVDGKIILQTLFQRFTNEVCNWRGCGHFSPNGILLFGSGSNITVETINLILSLLKGETVIIKEEHNPDQNYFIGKKVSVFNQEQWDATIIIQKQWKKCRYNPSFKMCERVQLRNLNDVMEEFGKQTITVN
jgi:hypothetical protein